MNGERHWWVTYSCDHEEEVVTFIGDFDYVAAHQAVPDICRTCRLDKSKDSPIVWVVSAELIDMPAQAAVRRELETGRYGL